MVVTVFSVCEKFLGFLYRIFLSRSIGTEGIGLYQVALSVFALLLNVTCSGTPITVSRLMTKYRAENCPERVAKVITAALTFTLAVALPICIVFGAFNHLFSFVFADERCMKIFLIVLPGLIFTSIYSILRGVFWGNKDFLPYSATELLEEICMIIVGVVLIGKTTDVYEGAVKAGVAVLISYVFSFSLATAVFLLRKNKLKNPYSEFKPLLKSALPITAMRTANSLAVSLVSIILPLRLVAAGYESANAMSMFGAAVGQAIPLLFIPTTLIGSFTLVLVPEISENYYKKNDFYLKRDVEKAIKFTVLLTCFFIPVFFVCGEEIGILIFGGYECGKYLTASSFLMLFMSISNISTSILNSMGLEHKTLIFYLISGTLMLLSVWFLPAVFGIYALLIGFTFIYGLTSILNLRLLNKNCRLKPAYLKFTFSSVAIVLPTILFGLMTEKLLLPVLGTFLTFIVSSLAMVVFIGALYFAFGMVSLNFFKNSIKKIGKKKSNAMSA